MGRAVEEGSHHEVSGAGTRGREPTGEVAPFVRTGFWGFKWRLCSGGLSMGAGAAPSTEHGRAGRWVTRFSIKLPAILVGF
jgi:hypothetical protein